MNLTSFRGVTFTTLGVVSPKFAAPDSPGPNRQAHTIARLGASPILSGVSTDAQRMTFLFQPATSGAAEPVLSKVLAAINPDDPTTGLLVGQFLKTAPSTYVTVEAEATAETWGYPDVNTLAVTFAITSPWRESSATTLLAATTYTADGSFANANTGYRDVLPALTIGALTRGATKTATYGYAKKFTLTLTNTGAEPFVNYPFQIGPLNTAALVSASDMLASGNDVRIFCEGLEWPRNLVGMNTERTFIWTVIQWLAPGQSITIEIVHRNASAGSPPTLTLSSYPLRPAIDISGLGYTGVTSATTTTITVTGAGWETDQWQGGTVITGLTGTGSLQMRRVQSNTPTVLTLTRAMVALATTTDMTVIKSGFMGNGGTASGGGSTFLDDAAQAFRTNEWIGATVRIVSGTGSGQTRTITGNTPTRISVASWTTTPDATSVYSLYQPNGVWMWDVRDPPKTSNHPGLWQANKIQAPPTIVTWDAPGSWYRFTYARSKDAYSQPRYYTVSVGAGDNDHVPTMNIQRARKGKTGKQREVGVADAVGVASPVPINGAYFGYRLRSAKRAGSGTPGEGMCEARFMTQESGGENWSTFLSDIAVHDATLTVAPIWYDLTGYGSPARIAISLIPSEGDEIPDADSNTAQLRNNGAHFSLSVNPNGMMTSSIDWIATTPTAVTCYDMYLIIRTGGAGATKPYSRIVIGAPSHRLFLEFAGGVYTEQIKVDCETHIVSLVNSAGTFIRRIPYAFQAQDVTTDSDGTQREIVAARWLPIRSNTVDSANIYFSDPSGASWGTVRISAAGELGYMQ